MVNVCCVSSCENRRRKVNCKLHRFPANEKLRALWLDKIGNPTLLTKTSKQIYDNYRICDLHFRSEDRIVAGRRGAGLKATAVPCLLLPSSEFENTRETARECTEPSPPVCIEDMPSTSRSETPRQLMQQEVVSTPRVCRDIVAKNTNILKSINVRSSKVLTPVARRLFRVASGIGRCARKLTFEVSSTKKHLRNALKFAESGKFMKTKMNAASYQFMMSQVALQQLKPKGRRYSLDDKIFALGLMKQSGSGYRLLRKIFAVPSRKTLVNLLNKIPFTTGLNKPIFEHLKKRVQKMKLLDRYCTITFDEMHLQLGLQYDKKCDKLDGFQDNGKQNSMPYLADKALVFMARGIYKKWKQPLAYYLNSGGMKADMLAPTLKAVIRAATQCGLIVAATVCDQGGPNRRAINILMEETRRESILRQEEPRTFGFCVGDVEVVPLYDPPHLLKGIRNNFFEHNCELTWKSEKIVATWDDIKKVYDMDKEDDSDYRMLHKLNDNHIYNLKKMKVSLAAQVFSQRVASTIRGLTRIAPDKMTTTAMGTAEFILFINHCFDSVNGSAIKSENELRKAVTLSSSHDSFWIEAIKTFESMKFIKKNGSRFVPPSVQNWIKTLQGLRYLWTKLRSAGFEFLIPRNLNQDPLENFFGRIRSHGIRNVNPTCQSFKNSFKSLLLNNFLSTHSPGANCEDDDAIVLDNLKEFVVGPELDSPNILEIPDVSFPCEVPESTLTKRGAYKYVAGYIAKQTLKDVQNCKSCKADLAGPNEDFPVDFLLQNKQYSINAILHPTSKFSIFFNSSIHILENIIHQVCHKDNLKSILTLILEQNLPYEFHSCSDHNLFNIVLNNISNMHILTWSSNINKILKGKLQYTSTQDPVKLQAAQKHIIQQKITKKMADMKSLV